MRRKILLFDKYSFIKLKSSVSETLDTSELVKKIAKRFIATRNDP